MISVADQHEASRQDALVGVALQQCSRGCETTLPLVEAMARTAFQMLLCRKSLEPVPASCQEAHRGALKGPASGTQRSLFAGYLFAWMSQASAILSYTSCLAG